ncbi:non-canonical purine NTP pyrophosphatase [Clostridium omnivorum]|uniref:Non-canonical purine NTP pyrophosphatase n=1 Tax=Clostridium omnivorum TaxID=1604902 RepID=A0ABQ5N5G4_9CLOT|nr:non-canonical purine NTP pyrophosphatase [Clostridium sp. E14]GLC30391.1 hypothetical protein bsdE14_18010 [Clostridium sp. E14]
MKLLYGTANPAKLKHMREMLQGLDIEIIGLKDVDIKVDSIDENGNNPLENAKIKAIAYYKAAKMPVFSCDTGLYIEGLYEKRQPGVHVRRVNGKTLNDEQMIEYYTSIASQLGGTAVAKYKNAICLVMDENSVYEYDGEDISSEKFLITTKVHKMRDKGFPLDSISIDIKTKKYFIDLKANSQDKDERNMAYSFKQFFKKSIY